MKTNILLSTLRVGLIGVGALTALGACDGDNGNGNPTTTTDTTSSETTTGDTTTTTDTRPPEEIDVGPVTPGTVKALQAEATLVDCVADAVNGFITVNPTATIADAIVVSAKFNASGDAAGAGLDGYYVADAGGGAWSGILVTTERAGAFEAGGFAIGDKVDVAGELQEFFCFTQLKASSITADGTGTAPDALAVATGDVGEALESVLVKLSGVTLEPASASGGLKIAGSDIGVSFDIASGFIELGAGGKYDITGVIGYAFDKWQILPRSPADITVIEAPPTDTVTITSIQDSAISKTCPTPAPQFQNGVRDVSIEGVVVVGNYPSSGSDAIIVSDGTQNPYSAVQVRFPMGSIVVAPGDNVKAAGDHVEFYCFTQLNNATVTKTEGTVAVPAPVTVLKSETELEQYEGMLVEMTDVQIIADDGHGAGTTDGIFLVDKTIMGSAFKLADLVGKTVRTLRGVVFYSFDKYRVAPRSADDIVITQ
ncbi:MAG: hypothetical protein IT385_19345 [Deltaproteobacteria bacterium]|nr:hypothetical protein [Deltaproteobacteria bacterium]